MMPSLRMEGIVKHFGDLVANDAVDLEVRDSEIHGLLGENGAGKTTLMNILYGIYQPNAGRIFLNGEEVHIDSPRTAIARGVGMVHQHFMLVPTLTVAENLMLGEPGGRGPFLELGAAEARIRALAENYGFRINPRAKVWQLSVGEQQRVEIVRALYRGADLLILDEPTAVLTPQESDELFGILRELVAQGRSVILISHKLEEIMAITDRVTILRDGRRVGTKRTAETSVEELARLMVGREVLFQLHREAREPGPVVLEVGDLDAALEFYGAI
ncbi:MAG: ABC transporter ATP-binding protein, partial [Nitrospinota bacterium]